VAVTSALPRLDLFMPVYSPEIDQAKREASEWIARLNSDDVSTEDRAQFELWKRAHPFNARAYDELSLTWIRFLDAGALVRASEVAQPLNLRVQQRKRHWSITALAAGAVIATLLAGLYGQWLRSLTRFETAIGEQTKIALPDGSMMDLNSNSRVEVHYSPLLRIIHLKRGEAFFKVAHDVRRPFWVTSGNCWIRAVGTQFDVYKKPVGLRVTVSEGAVQLGTTQGVRPFSQSVSSAVPAIATLFTGQQADLNAASVMTRSLSADDMVQALGWRDGSLYFADRALADVVAELNRYTSDQLILEDDELRTLVVGGTFQANPLGAEALLHSLQVDLGVSSHRVGNRILIGLSSKSRDREIEKK